MINNISRVTIISPHPDDETLSAGGSLLRFNKLNIKTSCLVVSGHLPPLYKQSDYETTKSESLEAFKKYGIYDYEFLEIPATTIHEEPIAKINKMILSHIYKFKPDLLLIPFPDRHIDHRVIFDSSMVASRPNNTYFPKIVMAYETLSETHWNAPNIEPNFSPNVFFNITEYIDKKLEVLSIYKSQITNNISRSQEAVKALAKFRGSQNGCGYAEAFQLIRQVY